MSCVQQWFNRRFLSKIYNADLKKEFSGISPNGTIVYDMFHNLFNPETIFNMTELQRHRYGNDRDGIERFRDKLISNLHFARDQADSILQILPMFYLHLESSTIEPERIIRIFETVENTIMSLDHEKTLDTLMYVFCKKKKDRFREKYEDVILYYMNHYWNLIILNFDIFMRELRVEILETSEIIDIVYLIHIFITRFYIPTIDSVVHKLKGLSDNMVYHHMSNSRVVM